MLTKGTLIRFTKRPGTSLRSDIQGKLAELTRDFTPGGEVHVIMMEGNFKGRDLHGELKENDFELYILNKGK